MLNTRHSVAICKLVGATLTIGSTMGWAQEDARPELGGIWTNAALTRLTRPENVEPLVVTAAQAYQIATNTSVAGLPAGEFEATDSDPAGSADTPAAPAAGGDDFGLRAYNDFWIDPGSSLARVKGEFRSSYIIDPENGQIPRLETPAAQLQRRNFGVRYATGVGDMSGPEALPLSERCLIGFGNTAGPGMMGTLYNSTYRFVQTDEYVVIEVEMVHDARIIPLYPDAATARLNQRPVAWQQWFGDSRGWYENGELIVETVNINPQQMEQSAVPITADGKITERFSRYSDTEIVYQFTVEDDNLYAQPWTAELSFHASEGPMYEYACHEGNYAMPGILAGARRQEAEAAAQ
ncbi:hypothetical protein [Pseudohongiella sp.]|uniref:Uncharacterized protein n=1 Tax=marine sediment metagenome TaxID=412755 RepID=A0A0F9WII8_9ZZZZ|nr:hypothetical protein [Pseudohongiella sp.]HDZ07475.1 hypothetical protein [Pseudohongiella sp.]HEA63020.1 hypothetical protein [Pseudohongiella sp.]